MTIYHLYVKQHTITKLFYFGKTIRNPFNYIGSGSRWLKHINKNGKEYVRTIIVFSYNTLEEAKDFALKFSIENNIVEDNQWANYKTEDCETGGEGLKHSEETRKKMSESTKGSNHPLFGKKHKPESLLKMSASHKGVRYSEERKLEISKRITGESNPFYGKTHTKEWRKTHSKTSKHWYKNNPHPLLGKHHSEETKEKIRISHTGKTHSEETKKNMSGLNHPKVDKTIREWVHPNHGSFTGTNYELWKTYENDLNRKRITNVSKLQIKTHKGWSLVNYN